MRFSVSIFMAALLFLGACAPGGGGTPATPASHPLDGHPVSTSDDSNDNADENPVTPVPTKISDHGTPFTIGGDQRVVKEVQTQRPDPTAPLTPVQEKELAFSDSIVDAKLLRYNKKNELNKFGNKTFELRTSIKAAAGNNINVVFTGDLNPSGNSFEFAKVAVNKPGYGLTGHITDGNNTSIGTFEIRYQDRRAKVFYRAYKVKWDIRTKESQNWKGIEQLKSKLERLKVASDEKVVYGWAQNLVVAGITVGVSRFHYDFLINSKAGAKIKIDDLPTFSFDGDSVAPAAVASVPVESTKGDVENMKEEGDAGDLDSRVFSATIKGPKGESADFLMIASRDSEEPEELLPPNERPPAPPTVDTTHKSDKSLQPPESVDEDWDLSGQGDDDLPPSSVTTSPKPSPSVPVQKVPTQAPKPATPPPAPQPRPTVAAPPQYRGIGQNAFFFTDYNNPKLPRTKRVIDAFERDYEVRQVQNQIGLQGGTMTRFFYYATPFVDEIQSIAETYDMPPLFVFMIVSESRYFSGPTSNKKGRFAAYTYDNPPECTEDAKRRHLACSDASGPFQFLYSTAKGKGLAPQRNRDSIQDERNYFLPSACAAALYLSQIMDMFRDPTLGIMAYYRGEGTIKSLVQQKIRLYADYSLDYATIARNRMVVDDWINYVARIVAAYFIAGDYPHHLSYDAKTKQVMTNPMPLKDIPSAKPPFQISSPTCQKAVAKSLGS